MKAARSPTSIINGKIGDNNGDNSGGLPARRAGERADSSNTKSLLACEYRLRSEALHYFTVQSIQIHRISCSGMSATARARRRHFSLMASERARDRGRERERSDDRRQRSAQHESERVRNRISLFIRRRSRPVHIRSTGYPRAPFTAQLARPCCVVIDVRMRISVCARARARALVGRGRVLALSLQ